MVRLMSALVFGYLEWIKLVDDLKGWNEDIQLGTGMVSQLELSPSLTCGHGCVLES